MPLGGQRFALGGLYVEDCDFRAFFSHPLHTSPADADGTPGDNGYSGLEAIHDCSPLV